MIQRDTTDFKNFDFVNDYDDTLRWLGSQEVFFRDLKYKLQTAKMEAENFKVGDVLICVKKIEFGDGTTDKVGDEFTVEPRTINYYNHYCNKPHYVKKC